MSIPRPIVPKEHGSWAVVLVPLAIGASVGAVFTLRVVLLALSALGIFLSYLPVQIVLRHYINQLGKSEEHRSARFWSVAFLLAGFAFALPLLLQGWWLLLPMGVLGVGFFFASFFLELGRPKNVGSNLTGVAGLTLAAPGAYYVTAGILDVHALILWLLNFLFFGSGIIYVHMKMRAKANKASDLSWSDKISIGKLNLLYHFVVVMAVLALVYLHFTTIIVLIAFVPMMVHAIVGTIRLSAQIRFRRLGYLLLAQSIAFAILLSLTMRT